MLITINLLSSEKIVKEERTEYLAIGYALIIIFIVALAGMYASIWQATSKIYAIQAEKEAKLQEYKAIVQEVEQLQAINMILATKKNVIDSLRDGALLYPWFLQTIAARTPAGVGYKNMHTTLSPTGDISAQLDAMALDNYAIADCIGILSIDKEFSQVDLGAITAIGAENSTASNFRLSFNYARKKD